jgi:hypothetical protein
MGPVIYRGSRERARAEEALKLAYKLLSDGRWRGRCRRHREARALAQIGTGWALLAAQGLVPPASAGEAEPSTDLGAGPLF